MACGHPDKICDQIVDAVLDAVLALDPKAFVGCEATVCGNKLHLFGEITAKQEPDYEAVARETIREIGYDDPKAAFSADTCDIQIDFHDQSPDITRSINRFSHADAGAGDAGIVVGYACDETSWLMPMPAILAENVIRQLEDARRSGTVPGLFPDGKAQVSVEYDHDRPVRVSAVVVCAQHAAEADIDTVRDQVTDRVIREAIPNQLLDDETLIYVNPTGRFVKGGPAAKSGLSGRKTADDTYGTCARWGGSSLSGKDATKINRSGSYLARYLAKNVVAAKLARRCEVRLSYALGLADPINISVDTFGTQIEGTSGTALAEWMKNHVDMRPSKIIDRFNLRRPFYRMLSAHGHFGANAQSMPWEAIDLADRMAADLG